MLHFKMWSGIAAALSVTIWLSGLTHALLDMSMAPEDKNKYYVEEGGSTTIECFVIVDIGVEVSLRWSSHSINASKPQRVSYNPQEKYDRVGNWLNITHFSNTTAGEYKCRAKTSAPDDLSRIITLVKSCDVGKFSPPSCQESCSANCNPVPDGAKGRNCDHISGRCLYGCQEGYTGLNCTECDVERFSPPSCNKRCSAYCRLRPGGAKGRNCDHINGTCLSGCQDGYKMPYCTEKSDEPDDKVIGGVIGGVIVLCLIVVVMTVVLVIRHVRKNKKRRKKKGDEEVSEDNIGVTTPLRTVGNEEVTVIPLTDTPGHNPGRDVTDDTEQKNQSLKHEASIQTEAIIEEGSLMSPKLDKLKEEKKSLQKEKEQLIKDKACLEGCLEQQKMSAEKTAEIQAELNKVQAKMHQMEADLEKAASKEKTLQKEKEQLEKDKAFLEGRLKQQEISGDNKNAEIQAELNNVQARKHQMEADLEKAAFTEKTLQKEKEQLIKDKAFLEGRFKQQELSADKTAEIQAKLDKVQDSLHQLEEKLKKETSKKNKLQEEHEEIITELDKMGTFSTNKEGSKDKRRSKDKLHRAESRSLKTQSDLLTEENKKLKLKYEAHIKKLTEEIKQKTEEKENADKDIETAHVSFGVVC